MGLEVSVDFKHRIFAGLREGGLLGSLALSAFIFLALMTYDIGDPGWRVASSSKIGNAGGAFGAWLADVMLSFLGYVAYISPLLVAVLTWRLLRNSEEPEPEPPKKKKGKRSAKPPPEVIHPFDWGMFSIRLIGLLLILFSGAALSLLAAPGADNLPFGAGGIVGMLMVKAATAMFSVIGSILLFFVLFLLGITAFTDISWFKVMDDVGAITLTLLHKLGIITWKGVGHVSAFSVNATKQAMEKRRLKLDNLPIGGTDTDEPVAAPKAVEPPSPPVAAIAKPVQQPALEVSPPPVPVEAKQELLPTKKRLRIKKSPPPAAPPAKSYKVSVSGDLPSLELLTEADHSGYVGYSEEQLESMSRLLETKLKDFGVVAEVVAVSPGPVITRFEVQPAAGVKAVRITNLARDLARSLTVMSVRVVEVIPGKSVVGLEIPNENRQIVYLSEVLNGPVYQKSSSKLTLALGYDIAGSPIVADLAKMPHLLVAGTTGSGKSVGVNAMLLSLLYKAGPDEVRLMMIDPKMLELSVYDGIPHLLTPVITDMKDAASGLRWCVAEMERRYKLMAAMGVRNIAGFNKKISEAEKSGNPISDPLWNPEIGLELGLDEAPVLETLPFVVVVIDELADMMMIVGKKVEELIARIAQKARAAGIHLILATQRPSVDVLTGLIKANVPTRMAFQVSSKIDSRTIIDQSGAEQLLGHGDMLFLPPGSGLPVRVHGAFVDDDEVHRVVEDWKSRGEPNYIEEILGGGDFSSAMGDSDGNLNDEADELYDQAVAFVTETRKASISSVQRKLRIGYNRAARMIETMEAAGVISPTSANGSREVLAPPPPK